MEPPNFRSCGNSTASFLSLIHIFNTVQYSGVDSTLGSGTYGEVISTAAMRSFTFRGQYRF